MKKIWDWLLIENNRKVLSFLGTGVVVMITASWTYFTYFDQVENKDAKNKSPIQTNEEKIIRNKSDTPFMGVYIGINTQGTIRLPTKITFKHLGDKVTGTYTLSGILGTMNGTVSGNTYNYVWKLGGYSGRGVSIVQGNTINGTWGYDSSDNNGGTLTAQLQ